MIFPHELPGGSVSLRNVNGCSYINLSAFPPFTSRYTYFLFFILFSMGTHQLHYPQNYYKSLFRCEIPAAYSATCLALQPCLHNHSLLSVSILCYSCPDFRSKPTYILQSRPRWSRGNVLASRFAGSNPAEIDGFFQDVKILSTRPPGGILSWGFRVWDFRLFKEPHAWKNRPLSKI